MKIFQARYIGGARIFYNETALIRWTQGRGWVAQFDRTGTEADYGWRNMGPAVSWEVPGVVWC